MKVKLVDKMVLVITPESYVEHVALKAWVDHHKIAGSGLLIEAYSVENNKLTYCPCHMPEVHGHEKRCPEYKKS